MGTRGPIPKRMNQRLGHLTKADKAGVSRVKSAGAVKPPRLRKDIHHVARSWYESLAQSGQSKYYEPSDWALAVYAAEAMSRSLEGDRFSSDLFRQVFSVAESLLTTEWARRRARIEVDRSEDGEDDESRRPVVDYRKMLGVEPRQS